MSQSANHSHDNADGSVLPELEAFRLRWREEIKTHRIQDVMTRFPPELRLHVLQEVFHFPGGVLPYSFDPWILNVLLTSKEFYREGLRFLVNRCLRIVIVRKLYTSPGKNHHLVTLGDLPTSGAANQQSAAQSQQQNGEDPICTYLPTTQKGGSVEAVESFKRLGAVKFTAGGRLGRTEPTLCFKVVTRPASLSSPFISMAIQRLSVSFDIDKPSDSTANSDQQMLRHLACLGRALQNLTEKHLKSLQFMSVDFGPFYRDETPPSRYYITAEDRFAVRANELEVDVCEAWFEVLRKMVKVGRDQQGVFTRKGDPHGQV